MTFDDSLPALAACVKKYFGDTELREGLSWRNSAGGLTFYIQQYHETETRTGQ